MRVSGNSGYFFLDLEELAEVIFTLRKKMNLIFLSWDGQGAVENILHRGIIGNRDMQVHSFAGDIHRVEFRCILDRNLESDG